jgi:predicted phosphodiesterase
VSVITILGDIHGDFENYRAFVEGRESTIQVGDYGLGFDKTRDKDQLVWAKENPQHKFIRGNHDNPRLCKLSPSYIPDGTYDAETGIMYIGGAWSIDYWNRIEGKTWWADEEISSKEFKEIREKYLDIKPNVVVSHDAPFGVPKDMGLLDPNFGGPVITRTGAFLNSFWQQHKPSFWFFGHYHTSATKTVDATNFVCVGEHKAVVFNTVDKVVAWG